MKRKGVSGEFDYGNLFQDWEIAVAIKLIDKFRKEYSCLKLEEFKDLLQECLVHWHNMRNSYSSKHRASRKTYMARIIKNKLLDLIKERETDKRKINHLALSLDMPLKIDNDEAKTLLDIVANSSDKKSLYDQQRQVLSRIDLTNALRELSERQRKICDLIIEGQLNVTEISELLRTPRSTIYDEIDRIRNIFIDEGLENYFD